MKKILPEDIRVLYKEYKKNDLIKDFNNIALILSINEINNASKDDEKTKKNKLYDGIFSISKKCMNDRKKN